VALAGRSNRSADRGWERYGSRLKPDPNLRPGAFARAEVTVSNARRTVLPQTAVLTDEKGTYVLVVTAEKKSSAVPYTYPEIVGNGVSIADGVKDKEEVVATAGAFFARRVSSSGRY